METASSELLGVSSLPPSVLALIFRLLPEADRCRSGGVSRAWRAIAHAPALWGPNLVLAPVLEAPRTVCDTTKGADSVCIYGVVKRRSKSRASATSVLRSLAKLTGGTLKSIDARQNWRCESFSSPFACTLESEQPDVVWAEELVDICAANTGLDEVVTDQPASCEGAYALVAQCPRVGRFVFTRLVLRKFHSASKASRDSSNVAAKWAMPPPEVLPRLRFWKLDFTPKVWPTSHYDGNDTYGDDWLGVMWTADARQMEPSLVEAASAFARGALWVRELHLPGCRGDYRLLERLLAPLCAVKADAGTTSSSAASLAVLWLHFSSLDRDVPLPVAVARTLARIVGAIPSLEVIVFADDKEPTSHEPYEDLEKYERRIPSLSNYLVERCSEHGGDEVEDEMDDGGGVPLFKVPTAAGKILKQAREARGGRLAFAMRDAREVAYGNQLHKVTPILGCGEASHQDVTSRLLIEHGLLTLPGRR